MKLTYTLLATTLALSLTAACSKAADEPSQETPPAEPEQAQSPKPAPAAPAQPTAAETNAPAHAAVFAAYEQIREKLAADEGKGVSELAVALKAVADQAAADAAGDAKTQLAAIVAAAAELAKVDGGDLAGLRVAFGKVSQPIVALVEADDELAGRYHVFECPMAKGYKRWVQPDAALENPYMGTKMLTCGSEVTPGG